MDIVQKTQKKVELSKEKLSKTIKMKSYRKLAVNFLILSLNLIVIILYFSLSQVKILIVPTKSEISHEALIEIKEQGSEQKDGLYIEGKTTNIEIDHEKTFAVEQAKKTEKNARGKITIYNKTSDKNQVFIKETRFKNEQGFEIKLLNQIQVPPGGKLTVDAYATEIGKKGEKKAGADRFQVVALPYLKDKIYGEITSDFTGGEAEIKTISASEFENSKNIISDEIKKKAIEIFLKAQSENFNENNISIEIKELNSTANPGDENIESYTMKAKAIAKAFTYDEKNAKEIAKQELIKKIPPDKILVSFNEDSFSASYDQEKLMLKAQIKAQVQTKIPDTVFKQEEIIGMNEEETREYFTKITGIRDVEINFWPFWVRSVPNMKDHIDIEIKK